MRNVLVCLVCAVVMMIGWGPSRAGANEEWITTVLNENPGYVVYIITESIESNGVNWAKVTTKEVVSNQSIRMINWTFERNRGGWFYKSSKTNGKYEQLVEFSLPDKILVYCVNYIKK